MNQNYGALRVVRILSSTRVPTGEARTQSRSPDSWLPEDGLVHILTHRETALGRALNNDIILLDLAVSREHARLALHEDGWHITNLTDQNVVRVNGCPVPAGGSSVVCPQDILVLGNTMLQLVAPRNHHELLLAEQETLPLALNVPHDAQMRTPDIVNKHTMPLSEQSGEHAQPMCYETLPPLSLKPDKTVYWDEEAPESVLGAGITMRFALPQRMGLRMRWLIAGMGMTVLLISALITLFLNGQIGISVLEQNGVSSFLTALTIPLLPAVGIFLLVNFMDRYEREPWFLRLAAFLWGAIIAIPPALFIETQIDTLINNWLINHGNNLLLHALYQGLNAGITEETIKGLGLILLFIILRDEFDNVTDGIVYGALIGAGFAMVENFTYFALNGRSSLAFLIVGRIVLGWLGHSTFIACFGAALGYIRHTRMRWKQLLMPLLGYLLAVGLHSFFDFVNFQASTMIRTASANGTSMDYALAAIICNYIPPFLAQMGLLYLLIKSLAHEAAVIREFLAVEVSNGIVTIDEYALLQNSFQRTKRERQVWRQQGTRQWLRVKALYQTEIGLAFRKWHVSMGDKPKLGYLQPEDAYRERIRRLRHDIRAGLEGTGRPT
ncbi:MAG: PrsW family glutamic-type intramembrane protease [Ktedonobacteraceae bacterium]